MLENALNREIKNQHVTLTTRLGMVHVLPENIYTFEEGLYGFSNAKNFVVAPMPALEESSPFFVMQSLDDESLCFILLNSSLTVGENVIGAPSIILEQDIEQAAITLNIPKEDTKVAFLVSFHPEEGKNITINTMAPLFFSDEQKIGWQVLLNNPIYNVKEPLS